VGISRIAIMNTFRKKGCLLLIAIGIYFLFSGSLLSASDSLPSKVLVSEIQLPAPKNPADINYLGLKEGANFKVNQVIANVVIVEIFSMYCPACQREAPEVNRLYSIIKEDPFFKDKIKLIGIGTGNSEFEVGVFKKKYNVPFPLIPDENFYIHKRIGEVRTPYFLGISIDKQAGTQVFYSKAGKFKGAEPFLEKIIQLSGLKKEE